MKSILAITMLSIVLVMGVNSAYADTSVDVAIGSSVPGCEEIDISKKLIISNNK
jgi:hypothetical protein